MGTSQASALSIFGSCFLPLLPLVAKRFPAGGRRSGTLARTVDVQLHPDPTLGKTASPSLCGNAEWDARNLGGEPFRLEKANGRSVIRKQHVGGSSLPPSQHQ